MEITTDQVKKLRDETGISVMQCKKALEEADGDEDKARLILQKQSKKAAEKKADRDLGAGVIQAYIHNEGTVGTLVQLSCETDFVARNDEFRQLAYDIAMHVAASAPEYARAEEVTEDARKKAQEMFSDEVADKPDDLKEKILDGKLNAFFSERILLEQPYIKDPDRTIGDIIDEAIQKFGENITVSRFERFTT